MRIGTTKWEGGLGIVLWVFLLILFSFLLECNCFTMLYSFPLYNKVNQQSVCMDPFPLEPPSHLTPIPPLQVITEQGAVLQASSWGSRLRKSMKHSPFPSLCSHVSMISRGRGFYGKPQGPNCELGDLALIRATVIPRRWEKVGLLKTCIFILKQFQIYREVGKGAQRISIYPTGNFSYS